MDGNIIASLLYSVVIILNIITGNLELAIIVMVSNLLSALVA